MANEHIKLTEDEILMGAMKGISRNIYNWFRANTRPAYGAGKNNDWQYSIEGCLGEMALAKFLNVFFNGDLGKFGAPDVNNYYEARTSPLEFLSIRSRDKPNKIYICINGRNGNYIVRGWIYGHEGKRPEYYGDKFNNGRPNYWVPFEDLHSMTELPKKETQIELPFL